MSSKQEDPPYLDVLRRVSWHAMDIALENVRDDRAREHPLAVLQGVLLSAAANGRRPQPDFFFHPINRPLQNSIRKGLYRLEIVFPLASTRDVTHYADDLHRYLSNGDKNFRLADVGPPRQRSLQTVAADFPDIRPGIGELCLEFCTPFPFTPADKSQRLVIGREAFFLGLARRVETLFGIRLGNMDEAFSGATLLPYYWDYVQHRSHRAKSHPGEVWLHGVLGPLYIKGELDPVLPLLLVCAELHATQRKSSMGQGYYRLMAERPFFDAQLSDQRFFARALDELEQESDLAKDIALGPDREALAKRLHGEVLSWVSGPAAHQQQPIDKGVQARDSQPALRDLLVPKALAGLLAPYVDRMLHNAPVGYQLGKSRETAGRLIADAIREGRRYVLEADIAAFFDQGDRDLLLRGFTSLLPASDHLTSELLSACLRGEGKLDGSSYDPSKFTPVGAYDTSGPRHKGLPRESPLTPLLVNLRLDGFDEAMERLGYAVIRHAGDYVVLCESREEAEMAVMQIGALLAGIGLWLNPEKTRIRLIDARFSLPGPGSELVADEKEDAFMERAALRKPLFVTGFGAFVGLDGEAVIMRREDTPLVRVPSERLSEVFMFGDGAVSTKFLRKCADRRVPVSFCSAGGAFCGTIRSESKRAFETAALQAKRREAMTESEVVEVAKAIVRAKLAHYVAWFRRRVNGASEETAVLEKALAGMARAGTVAEARGFEGTASRRIYGVLISLLSEPGFAVGGRAPRKKADRFNVLLDFASYFLFTRLNVFLRSRGLNPYLGFLHSPEDRFESLTCDLQEPFRCRMDRMAVKLVNRGEIRLDDFEGAPGTGYRLRREAVGRLLERFERELATRLSSDDGTWGELLLAQTRVIFDWARGFGSLSFYGS
ncbi:MAG: CRISPR-associated endonuclease Cas1 [Solidesulfovibrio sp.]|uniref:CRISPR-associated endonuclease Cas1 n=1 Tax=Solidesulfovibrio sp. TaxID=2910990 RepID=UPI003159099B